MSTEHDTDSAAEAAGNAQRADDAAADVMGVSTAAEPGEGEAKLGVSNKVTKITEQLPVTLNDVEWTNKARELAAANHFVDEANNAKRSLMAQSNANIKAAEANRAKLSDIVSTRTELREVTVEQIYDYDNGTVTRKRTDTGEVLSTRDMIDAERQGQLIDADKFIGDARAVERDEDEDGLGDDDLED